MRAWGAWGILALGVVLATALVVAAPVTKWYADADEGYYLRYATRVARDGPGAVAALVREYLDDAATAANVPPGPTRVGVVLPDALAVRWLGSEFTSLQRVSLAALLVLLVVVGRGLAPGVGDRIAVGTALLLAASPLGLGMARRALSDNLNALLMTIALLLCIEALARDWRRGWSFVAVGFAAAFLAKELNLVLIPIGLGLLAAEAVRRGRAPSLGALACISVVPVILATLVLGLLAGGLAPVAKAFALLTGGASGSDYARHWGGGPWFRYLLDFLLLSPATTLLYVVWLGVLLGERSDDPRLRSWALVPVLFVAVTLSLPKFVRWALPLDVPLRLGAAAALDRLSGGRVAVFAGLIGLLMVADLMEFHRFFVTADIYDPTTRLLLLRFP